MNPRVLVTVSLTAILNQIGMAQPCPVTLHQDFSRDVGTGIVEGRATALAVYNDGDGDALFAVGPVLIANGVSGQLLRWDGAAWTALQAIPGQPTVVTSLAVYDSGTGAVLFIGGSGVIPDARLWTWNGVTLNPVAQTAVGSPVAMVSFDDGAGLALYVSNIRVDVFGSSVSLTPGRLSNNTWSAVGQGLVSTNSFVDIKAMVEFNGALYVASRSAFTVNGVPTFMAKWDGSTWSPAGDSRFDESFSLATASLNGIPTMVAGVLFRVRSTPIVIRRALVFGFDGVHPWTLMGGPVSNEGGDVVFGVAGSGPNQQLIKGGGDGPGPLSQWNGSAWQALPDPGANVSVAAMTEFNDGTGDRLYMSVNSGILEWNGSSWARDHDGLDGTVFCSTTWKSGGLRRLAVGGVFVNGGETAIARIAIWDHDSDEWMPLASGLGGTVRALAEYDDGFANWLVAGGDFALGAAGELGIAAWDGLAWQSLGGGLNGSVHALAVGEEDGLPVLYASGEFTIAGGIPASRVAKWDGAQWSALGNGTDDAVFALEVWDDGTGPSLYAGGIFNIAGNSIAPMIARWDGNAWSGLGSSTALARQVEAYRTGDRAGEPPAVFALAETESAGQSHLVVGGTFVSLGGIVARRIAQWDGSSWSPMDGGMSDPVYALETHDDGSGARLYAGGSFDTAGSVVTRHLARWDGSSWTDVPGASSNRTVRSLAGTRLCGVGPTLLVGGEFTRLGSIPSAHVALLRGCYQPGDANQDLQASFADITTILGNWGECPPNGAACQADLDCSGNVGFEDITLVLGNWGAGL